MAASGDIPTRAGIIRAFLRAPLDRKCFNAFFEECLKQTVCCLSSLKARGYRLPMVDDGSGTLRDLAHSILGSLLRSERDKRPFHVVMDYFEGKGVSGAATCDDETLHGQFVGLIWSFTRQELFKISAQEDPQRANQKRRMQEVLREKEYTIDPAAGGAVEYAYLATNADNLRLEATLLTGEALRQLVERSYLDTCNLSQCCQRVFAELNELHDVQNRLRKHELISAVVAVIMRYLETDGFAAARLSTPESDYDAADMEHARVAAVRQVRETVIDDFVRKGRIAPEVADRLALAAELYLLDLFAHGNTDPIPHYFREVMLAEEHDVYLNKYKYVFETTINRAVEEFRSRFRD